MDDTYHNFQVSHSSTTVWGLLFIDTWLQLKMFQVPIHTSDAQAIHTPDLYSFEEIEFI